MARIMGGVQSVVTLINFTTFTAQVVTVVTHGTPVQLPNIVVPDGASLSIRASVGNGGKKILLADTSANTGIANSRLTLAAGESVELRVQNTNAVWIDASANNASVEFIVEQ